MAEFGKLTIHLSDDAYTVFAAARVPTCQSYNCVNHSVNNTTFNDVAGCFLKQVFIGKNGLCTRFEPKEEKAAKNG